MSEVPAFLMSVEEYAAWRDRRLAQLCDARRTADVADLKARYRAAQAAMAKVAVEARVLGVSLDDL